MPNLKYFRIVTFLLLIPVLLSYGDYLEVRRSAQIKTDPKRNGQLIEKVSPGTLLELRNEGKQTNGYYQVIPSTLDESGWIYRTLVRRHQGEVPVDVAAIQSTNPLADPTLTLGSEQRRYAHKHLRLGKPQAVHERVREAYALAHDARLKIPLWVQYVISPEELTGATSRQDDFRPDTSIPFGSRAELEDYASSGFDRGHMAPAADMKRSDQVMSESFLLSNMSPQVGIGFNRHIWKNLEAAIRGWVEQRGALTVITGPVFKIIKDGMGKGKVTYSVIGENQIAVPTHFFKIVVDVNNPDKPEALAFVIPNEGLSSRHYNEFLTAIDEIEALTGLDFLSSLPVTIQREIESQKASIIW